MPLTSVLVLIVQLALIFHALKTGRSRYWVLVLIFLPLLGAVAYLAMELIPGFSASITGQRAVRNVKKALDPGAGLRQHEAAWRQSPNVDNGRRYAEALLDSGDTAGAEDIIDQSLSGLFTNEPTLLLLRARIEYEKGQADAAVRTLEALQLHNPEFRSADGHLLYARALEAVGQADAATREYSAVSAYFPGVEARYRLALCLRNAGSEAAARAEFESILNDAKLAPPHFRKSQKTWLEAIKRELAGR